MHLQPGLHLRPDHAVGARSGHAGAQLLLRPASARHGFGGEVRGRVSWGRQLLATIRILRRALEPTCVTYGPPTAPLYEEGGGLYTAPLLDKEGGTLSGFPPRVPARAHQLENLPS